MEKCPKADEIIRPILEGKDIYKYNVQSKKWLISIPCGWTNLNRNDSKPENFFRSEYPNIYDHFIEKAKKQTKGKGLFKRDDQGNYWWELRPCVYWNEFYKEKIIYPDIVQTPRFFLDNKGSFFGTNTCYMITGEKLTYLLALLNSTTISWAFKKFYAGGGLGDKGYRYFKEFLENLPIPYTSNIEERIGKIALEVQTAKTQGIKTGALEKEIDNLIYSLYDLSREEILYIKNDSNFQ